MNTPSERISQHILYVLTQPKLYIPSTINIRKKVLTKAIWADKNGLVFGRLACTSSKTEIFKQNRNLDFNPEFSST